jgi:hypothetical protein
MPQRTPHEPAISSARKPKAGSQKPIPKPPSTPATRVKSFVRKILLASPAFPRLYADVVISSAPNSNEAKILAHNYKKIVALSNERNTQMSHSKSCTHIKVTGVRCGSPSLRGEQFCYFHQRMLRSVRFPSSRVLRSALLEDPESIQASLMEVVNGLLRGTLELKRGELILRALNTAVRNIRRVRFDLHQDEMIREIPNYPDQPSTDIDEPYEPSATPRRPPTREEVARSREADPGRILRRRRQSSRSLSFSNPIPRRPHERKCTPHGPNPCRDGRIRPSRSCRQRSCRDSRPRLSRRPRSTRPQRSATEANKAHANRSQPQARRKCETRSEKSESRTRERQIRIPKIDNPSSEGAQECSPSRKPWVSATKRRNKPRRGERKGRTP